MADAVGLATAPITATDRGSRSGRTARRGPLGPRLDGGLGLGRRLEIELDLDHAVGEAAGDLEPGLA